MDDTTIIFINTIEKNIMIDAIIGTLSTLIVAENLISKIKQTSVNAIKEASIQESVTHNATPIMPPHNKKGYINTKINIKWNVFIFKANLTLPVATKTLAPGVIIEANRP